MTKDTRAFNNYGDRKVGLPQEKFTSKTVGGKISIWDAVAPMSPQLRAWCKTRCWTRQIPVSFNIFVFQSVQRLVQIGYRVTYQNFRPRSTLRWVSDAAAIEASGLTHKECQAEFKIKKLRKISDLRKSSENNAICKESLKHQEKLTTKLFITQKNLGRILGDLEQRTDIHSLFRFFISFRSTHVSIYIRCVVTGYQLYKHRQC